MIRSYRNIILSEAAEGGLPVAYWPLDEANGTSAADLMAMARGTTQSAGAYSGGVTLGGAVSPINRDRSRSATLNGSSGYVTAADNSDLDTITTAHTIEGWFKPATNAEVDARLVAKRGASAGYEIYVITSTGKLQTFQQNAGGTRQEDWNNPTLFDGAWHHIAWTRSGTAHEVYVDGVVYSGLNFGTTFAGDVQNESPLTIGRFSQAAIRYLNGSAAHVAVYNYRMAAARVQLHYRAGSNGVYRSRRFGRRAA